MSFSNEKNDMLYVLESLSKRLLFPNTLVLSISKSISTLGYFMSKYNEVIKKSRELILNLDMLEKWSLFYDSKYCWSVSVNSCVEKRDMWINEIIGYITSKSNEFAIKTMIVQNNIDAEKIALFFQIRKEYIYESLQYTYEIREKNSITQASKMSPMENYMQSFMETVRQYWAFSSPKDEQMASTIDVDVSPDAEILAYKLIKSSGNKYFDNSALNALVRTQRSGVRLPPPEPLPKGLTIIFNLPKSSRR